MSLTYKELIVRAVADASAGLDTNKSPLVDLSMLAESQAPIVFQKVANAAASDPRTLRQLMRTYSLSVTSGLVTLAATVLTSYMNSSTLEDPANPTFEISFVRQWSDFRRTLDNRLGYYTVRDVAATGPQLAYIEPSAADNTLTYTGTLSLTAPSAPAIPTLETDVIQMPPELEDDILLALTNAVRYGIKSTS